MIKLSNKFTIMTVKHIGQVGAGKVVPFNARITRKTIAVPVELRDRDLSTFDVCGDSFINENILDGDVLVFRRDFRLEEVTPGRLCIVRVLDNENLLKRVHLDGDRVRLVSANPRFDDLIYSVEFVEIVGLVEGRPKFEPLS